MSSMQAFLSLGIVVVGLLGAAAWLVALSLRARSQAETQPARGARPLALHFKDGRSAHEYACKFMDSSVSRGVTLPALVLDAREFGAQRATKRLDSGVQQVVLSIPSGDGGFVVGALTGGPNGPELNPGDLVAWKAMSYSAEVAAVGGPGFGWIGLVIGTLSLEFRLESGWVGGQRLTN